MDPKAPRAAGTAYLQPPHGRIYKDQQVDQCSRAKDKVNNCISSGSLPDFFRKFLFWIKYTVSSMTNLRLQTCVHCQPEELCHPPPPTFAGSLDSVFHQYLISLTVRNSGSSKQHYQHLRQFLNIISQCGRETT